MWSEDPSQPDNCPSQTPADPIGLLVDLATERTELPSVRHADDKSPSSMWTAHKVEDRQVGYDEVGAGRREPG